MPTPGPQFQPVLPGMGRIKRAAPKAVASVTPHVENSGPVPGQTVMGVSNLARGRVSATYDRVPSSRFPGGTRRVETGTSEEHYHVDPHGYVQEGYQEPPHHDAAHGVAGGGRMAADLFGTHGGRFAKTSRQESETHGESPSELFGGEHEAKLHDAQVRKVRKHWNSQPVVQFPTSQLVHSTQDHYETEGDPTEYHTQRTPSGRTMRHPAPASKDPVLYPGQWGTDNKGIKMEKEDPSSGEGRQRIEAIKSDLAKGGKIRKPIWMTKVNGRYFQLDGHHRMVAAREMGHTHVPVRMWDQDAERGR